ncbi:hypothetical protein GCM10020000_40270 [Streptomyces olivoverticillatus]
MPSGEMFAAPTWLSLKGPKAQMKEPKVAMMMMLLRTGVHIIAPNRPRALRIWPSTTCTPMKNIVGRQYRAKATATSICAGSEAMLGDIILMKSGAPRTQTVVTPAIRTTTRVRRRLA